MWPNSLNFTDILFLVLTCDKDICLLLKSEVEISLNIVLGLPSNYQNHPTLFFVHIYNFSLSLKFTMPIVDFYSFIYRLDIRIMVRQTLQISWLCIIFVHVNDYQVKYLINWKMLFCRLHPLNKDKYQWRYSDVYEYIKVTFRIPSNFYKFWLYVVQHILHPFRINRRRKLLPVDKLTSVTVVTIGLCNFGRHSRPLKSPRMFNLTINS